MQTEKASTNTGEKSKPYSSDLEIESSRGSIFSFVRLRQICLATLELSKSEKVLSDVLGIQAKYHSPGVAKFGLANCVFPVNGSFIEIVAPTRRNTAVQRFLERSNGRGGYMAIFDCGGLQKLKSRVTESGVRIVYEGNYEYTKSIQLHPADIGFTLVEFDHHLDGTNRFGRYQWCGENWQEAISIDDTIDILGIELSTSFVDERASLWTEVTGKQTKAEPNENQTLALDYGYVLFQFCDEDISEHFNAVEITVRDIEKTLARARSNNLVTGKSSFTFCGVEFKLTAIHPNEKVIEERK